jgi:hypothetical protein
VEFEVRVNPYSQTDFAMGARPGTFWAISRSIDVGNKKMPHAEKIREESGDMAFIPALISEAGENG